MSMAELASSPADAEFGENAAANYGAGVLMAEPMKTGGPFLRGKRRSMNIFAILLGFFVPWLVYVVVASALSFKLRYSTPLAAYGLVLAALLVVLAFGILAAWASKQKLKNEIYEPSWYMFIFLTSLLAFLFGAWVGQRIYNNYTLHCYRSSEMTSYSDVNPSMMSGSQLMDAGVVNFAPGTIIDLTKWMSFKDRSVYCVAPIARSSSTTLSTYDFWAVGTDCCAQTWTSGVSGAKGYHCGDFNRKNASTGLRLMNDAQHPFFRLGVQQAEAAYHIRAAHPLFFHWTDMSQGAEDAGVGGACGSGGFSNQYNEGQAFFKRSIFTIFVLQMWLVAIACVSFSKLGYY